MAGEEIGAITKGVVTLYCNSTRRYWAKFCSEELYGKSSRLLQWGAKRRGSRHQTNICWTLGRRLTNRRDISLTFQWCLKRANKGWAMFAYTQGVSWWCGVDVEGDLEFMRERMGRNTGRLSDWLGECSTAHWHEQQFDKVLTFWSPTSLIPHPTVSHFAFHSVSATINRTSSPFLPLFLRHFHAVCAGGATERRRGGVKGAHEKCEGNEQDV